MRVSWSSGGLLATSIAAIWFIRKVQIDIRENKAANKNRDATTYQQTLIDAWRKMLTLAERKSGKEPGVSFA
jgi:hypothetical protein